MTGTAAGPREAGPPDVGSLTDAIQEGLSGTGIPSLSAGVRRLMAAYRSGEVPAAPVMSSRTDAAAYAAYRMPATAAATAMALRETRLSLPRWAPATLLDFGAGTGGAAWAAVGELPSIGAVTLLEQSADAIRLGTAILAASSSGVLRTAHWQSWRLPGAGLPGAGLPDAGLPDAGLPAAEPPAAEPPAANLATAAYVLGELTEPQQASLVDLAAHAAPVVVLVEPGTPAGHRRILAARARLLQAGFAVAAPCPHQHACPLAIEGDWCHFGARLQRSSVHRRVKDAELAYEDEKFSYVAMAAPQVGVPDTPSARVVRRPQQRKGLVMLEVCARDGDSRRELVSKSKGEAYRRARKSSWGDRWSTIKGSAP